MSTEVASGSEPKFKLTRTQWLICVIATIGFLFDIYELLMLPLIVKPALAELIGTHVVPGSHRWDLRREAQPHEVVAAAMPRGSQLFWLGTTLHAAAKT